jgi:hypothetical protein
VLLLITPFVALTDVPYQIVTQALFMETISLEDATLKVMPPSVLMEMFAQLMDNATLPQDVISLKLYLLLNQTALVSLGFVTQAMGGILKQTFALLLQVLVKPHTVTPHPTAVSPYQKKIMKEEHQSVMLINLDQPNHLKDVSDQPLKLSLADNTLVTPQLENVKSIHHNVSVLVINSVMMEIHVLLILASLVVLNVTLKQ